MAYSVISKDLAATHRANMIELASTPGLQRSRALPVLKKIATGYALVVSYGKGSQQVNGLGEPYVGTVDQHGEAVADGKEPPIRVLHDDPAGMDAGISTALQKIVVPGSAPMNKAIGTIHVPCGICVIVAKGGAGKTPLAHHLAQSGVDTYGVVRVGEPFAGYTTNRNTVARDLAKAMVLHSDVVLDSIKDLLAEGGNLMKGGIARAALTDLSAWATQAAAIGSTIYIPLNPSGDGELVELMTEVAKSNATMTISHQGPSTSGNGSVWAYSSRTGEGLARVEGTYTFNRTIEKTTSRAGGSDGRTIKFDASSISQSDFAGLLQRTRSL